jgi:hypothetical protein
MAPVLHPFPDAELVMLDLIPTSIGNTVTSTGSTVPAGTILVERVGGPDDGVTDKPRLALIFYGSTRKHAWEMCRKAQQHIIASGGTLVSGPNVQNVLIDVGRTATPPRQLSEFGRGARMVQIIVELHMRRQYPYLAH